MEQNLEILGYLRRESDGAEFVHYMQDGKERLTTGVYSWDAAEERLSGLLKVDNSVNMTQRILDYMEESQPAHPLKKLLKEEIQHRPAAEVSSNMSRIAAMAESGVTEVPSGTFKFGQLENLKRESRILGVDKYLNFNKRDCDIAVEKGFLEKFNKRVEETAERQQSRKVQEKRIEGSKL